MTTMTGIPLYECDLFSDEAILDPYPHYAALREAGPIVLSTAHEVYAVPRYEAARAALAASDILVSGYGTGLNELVNTVAGENTLNSDGALHEHLRKVLSRDLAPKSLREITAGVQAQADALVDGLLSRRSFDAVADLAHALPLKVVPDLIGWPTEGRSRLLPFAAAAFDGFGPNDRAIQALPAVGEMFEYVAELAQSRSLAPGSMGANILAAEDAGEISSAQCPMLLADLLAPSLDTTISAISSAVLLFATFPDQWRLVRENPELIPAAVNEVVRLESPVRLFSRFAVQDWTFDGFTVPGGSRALVMYGAANRDERRYPDPDSFDVTRDNADHLGFGYGVHGCVGQGLARLEVHSLLRSLASRVASFEAGEPTWQVNNIVRSLSSLPVTIRPADR